MTLKLFKATAMTTVAAAMAFSAAIPAAALAQSKDQPPAPAYDKQQDPYYDSCAQQQDKRALVGGATGAVAGAVIGHNVQGYKRDRSGNTIVGGVLGAIAGAVVGSATTKCDQTYADAPPPPAPPPPPKRAYRYAPPPPPREPYYDNRYAYAPPAPPAPPPPPQAKPQCTYVEDAVRMPDGGISKRMVHVCQDSNGQYQIVQ